jgi:hypothetical protein
MRAARAQQAATGYCNIAHHWRKPDLLFAL